MTSVQVKEFCATAQKEMPVIDKLCLNAALQFTGMRIIRTSNESHTPLSVSPVFNLCIGVDEMAKSQDGYEMTFAITHLAHFLMAKELLGCMSPNGSIIVPASDVRGPESGGGKVGNVAKADKLQGLESVLAAKDKNAATPELLIDGSPYDGDKAYKDAKLCNLVCTDIRMFTSEVF